MSRPTDFCNESENGRIRRGGEGKGGTCGKFQIKFSKVVVILLLFRGVVLSFGYLYWHVILASLFLSFVVCSFFVCLCVWVCLTKTSMADNFSTDNFVFFFFSLSGSFRFPS